MSARELGLAWLFLALVGILAYLPHLLHGGLYMDDWFDAAGALHPPGGPGLGNSISFFNSMLSSCRPVLILFIPLKYLVLGTSPHALLALALALALLVAILAYSVLRLLGVPWYHAGLLAALTLVYPWFDSTRFWESASPITLALLFALGGFWVALVALDKGSWRLHICASLLYLLSMLSYEITLPLIACAGIVYTLRSSWRDARWRWALDLIMVVIAGGWTETHTPRTVSTLSGDLDHARQIVTAGGELLGRSLFDLGPQPQTALSLSALALAGVAGVAAVLLSRHRPAIRRGWGMRNWLIMFAAGIVIAALGWVIFVPADPYYTPTIYGVSNRVNGAAGLGLILAVYAALGIAGTLIGAALRRGPAPAIALTLILGVGLGATYVHVLERHAGIWRDAYEAEKNESDSIKAAFPSLPAETTLFVSGVPAYQALGVPIFAALWDLDGRVKLLYGDESVRAYPITEQIHPTCEAEGIGIEADPTIPLAPYGTARLLDAQSGATATPRNRAACEVAIKDFPPAPTYVGSAY